MLIKLNREVLDYRILFLAKWQFFTGPTNIEIQLRKWSPTPPIIMFISEIYTSGQVSLNLIKTVVDCISTKKGQKEKFTNFQTSCQLSHLATFTYWGCTGFNYALRLVFHGLWPINDIETSIGRQVARDKA